MWQCRPQVGLPLCSSANINLRKAQAVVNILLKANRFGTWQDRHIPGSGDNKVLLVVCVDYGIWGFWPWIYAWLYCFLIKLLIWKVRWFLIYIYMLSVTRGRSNCFWIKLSYKTVSPTTTTVMHGRSVNKDKSSVTCLIESSDLI